MLEEAIKHSLPLSDTDIPRLTVDEWEVIRQLCDVLEHCADVTKEMSAENYVTASKIIPIMRGLKFAIRKVSEDLTQEIFKQVASNILVALPTGSLTLNEVFLLRYAHSSIRDISTTCSKTKAHWTL